MEAEVSGQIAKRGGKREGSGRKAGVPNKATAEIKTVAQQYGEAAVKKLAEMAGLVEGVKAAESEQARVSAIKEIMDRGYGKSAQPLEGSLDLNVIKHEQAIESLQ